jgi:glycosyltransferase involved in cell wall biosynthesis
MLGKSTYGASRHRRPVDLLVVCTHSTPGNRRSETELITALRELGFVVAVTSTDYGWIGRLPMSLNLMDLTRAISNRRATTRAMNDVIPRAIIYGTGGAALAEPSARLARAAVRFDSLAADNRTGMRHVIQRLLERRMVGWVALMLPFGSPQTWPDFAQAHRLGAISLPTPVEPFGRVDPDRDPTVVCYAGAPEKKRLDLLVGAWALADPPPNHRLLVTGIGPVEGRQWLSRRGISEPDRVSWCDHLDEHRYRALTLKAEVYLSASRYEDYGIAQLEALADGALLVTTASAGPYEALAIARALQPRLVADQPTVQALASALREAFKLSELARSDYQAGAARLLVPYSRRAFRERLAAEVLPALFAHGAQPAAR